MAGGRSRDDAARLAPPRRADDRRLGRRHRQQQPGRSVRRHHPGPRREARAGRGFASAISIPKSARTSCVGASLAGDTIAGLDGRPPLDLATLDATDRIVAMAGIHPYIKLLDAGRRRDHRRPQQRLRDLCGAGDPPRLSRGARLFLRQGARMRLVLRRALWRQGIGARRDHDGRRQGHRAAARAALHDRLGRRPCDVRAGQPVLRTFPRRPHRHERLPLRAI